MNGPPPVSLVIVSKDRPDALRRCLMGVAQLAHPNLEVIVVADRAGLGVAADWPVKRVPFDEPNISKARNLGIAAAAGEVVAFIDDDAVPLPLWLDHLSAPFRDAGVAAAGGFVLGSNGFSYQWRAGCVDRLLRTHDIAVAETETRLHRGRPGLAIEVKGVNCAYRRAVLADLGGFDPELAYYLDETELNLRLARLGAMTAVVPKAQVLHTKMASALRHADRVPKSLSVIGASTAITLRRHGATRPEMDEARDRLFADERQKLERLVAGRRLTRDRADWLMQDLQAGFAEGAARTLSALAPIAAPTTPFLRFPTRARSVTLLAGRPWHARGLRRRAAEIGRQGGIVRLFLFSPTTLFHRRTFTEQGYWMQTGGLFGRSERTDPLLRFWTFGRRVRREAGNDPGFPS